jgi:hypothetical protein
MPTTVHRQDVWREEVDGLTLTFHAAEGALDTWTMSSTTKSTRFTTIKLLNQRP